MTVTNQTSKIRYVGNGATVAFSFPFKIFAAGDLEVYTIDQSTDVATLKTISTHYTVSINANSDGGTVTFLSAPASTVDVLIKRDLDLTQPTDLPPVSNFSEEDVENELDRAVMLIQQLQEQIDRCLKVSETSEVNDITFPTPEAGKFLMWNDDEDGLENADVTITETEYPGAFSAGLDAAKPASPSVKDIYFATDTNKLYKCITAGSWTTKMVFGDAVDFAKGSDIASAATADIGAATGNFIHITGTTTITAFGTVQAGTIRCVRFAGALQLTHNSTSLILPTAANITTAAGDTAIFVSEGSGNWRCLAFQRADGTPLAGGVSAASQAEMETATDTAKFVTPGRVQYHPGVAKAWVKFNGTGTPAINASRNVTSITDVATGCYTINFTTAMSSADYAVSIAAQRNQDNDDSNTSCTTGIRRTAAAMGTGGISILVGDNSGAVADPTICCVVAHGDQ